MARDVADSLLFAEHAGLTFCSDEHPGYSRVGTASGVAYRDQHGKAIKDAKTLARIAALAIPPAWTDVWICPREDGHIQAIGRDAKGRKQYRYHSDWRATKDQAKYERMIAFGRALPRLRKQVEMDLTKRGLPREKVLAAVVRLLEVTLIRVGNDEYAKTNKSFGLTTMRKKHVTLSGVGAVFEFRGKSGKDHRTGFQDRRLARVIKACQELRGQRLFQYLDAEGHRHAIESADVNDYLRNAMGGAFTAKDFRTWGGSLAAALFLRDQPLPADEREAKALSNRCVKAVSQILGNTPAVCRAAYVTPLVFEAHAKGALRTRRSGRGAELALLHCLASG
jgi:DNA topoisomerase-1